MNKNTTIIIIILVLGFLGLVGFSIHQRENSPVDYSRYSRSTIEKMSKKVDFTPYDISKIIPPDANSGFIAEHIEGNEAAPIIIYEYADYQCTHCAHWASVASQIAQDYSGQVAVVFRNYILSYSNNGVVVASAANAAAIQGYWKPYKDLLFADQNIWYDLKMPALQDKLEAYFLQASHNQGDVARFREDMKSEAVAKKVAFDFGLADKADLQATPTFYIGDTRVAPNELRTTVEARLQAL